MTTEYYTVAEVAGVLGLHVKTVRTYIREGKLKGLRTGKQYRITRAELGRFVGAPVEFKSGQNSVSASASSTVEVDGLNAKGVERVTTVLSAAIKARNDAQALKVETLYDAVRARLRIVILGSLEATREVLGMIEHLVQRPAPPTK